MSYYTERHGMRRAIEKTYSISIDIYQLIFDCCSRYFENLAYKFSEECPDGYGCCGLNYEKFKTWLMFEVPDIYRDDKGNISVPSKYVNYGEIDENNQYALLDLIEVIANEIYDISSRNFHSYFGHDHISFAKTVDSRKQFQREINGIFEKTGLLFVLNEDGRVERVVENTPLNNQIVAEIEAIQEKGLKELLKEAVLLYKTPHSSARRAATEKIWDALERLKTYYTNLDKKQSAQKIVADMASRSANFEPLFDEEFRTLTKIGNNYRIRHHETDKIEIIDENYYDYFFNRCLSLIALSIKYLQ